MDTNKNVKHQEYRLFIFIYQDNSKPGSNTVKTIPKEFTDLQDKYRKEVKELNKVNAQIMVNQKDAKRINFTEAEVKRYENNDKVKLYRSVGKMFYLMSENDIMEDLVKEKEGLTKELENLNV